MPGDFVQIVQLVSPIVTPILILWLGLKINKTLEATKASMAKDKEWLTKWSERFYSAAIDFNSAVDDCILELFWIGKISSEKLPGWERRLEEKTEKIHSIVEKVSRSEWILKTTAEFAPNYKEEVLMHADKVFSLLSELLARKQGKIDEIRLPLFAFNKAAMAAHREILGK